MAGGFTDPKESAEETCSRELKERIGDRNRPQQFKIHGSLPNVYHYKEVDYNTLDLFFEYRVEEKIEIKN